MDKPEEKQPKSLVLGFIKSEEIAEWFGITYSTFRKNTKDRYKELENYCSFEKKYGGIEITEIRYPIYIKKKSKAYTQVKERVDVLWTRNEPETATRVADKIREENELKKAINISGSTYEAYVRFARTENWGQATALSEGKGALGKSRKVFVKMYRGVRNSENVYEELTPEDKEIYIKIHDKYLPAIDREQVDMIIAEGKAQGKKFSAIKKEINEYYEQVFNGINYSAYIKELSNALGCDWMVVATKVEDGAFSVDTTNNTAPFDF